MTSQYQVLHDHIDEGFGTAILPGFGTQQIVGCGAGKTCKAASETVLLQGPAGGAV